MISIFNRLELYAAQDPAEFARIRELLEAAGIEYAASTMDRGEPNPFSLSGEARGDSYEGQTGSMSHYRIYVKRADYLKAAALLQKRR